MAAGKVVGGVLFAADELLGVEQLAVGPRPDLVDHGRLEIDEHGTGHMLSGAGFTEKRVERVVASADGLVARHLAIGLQKQQQQRKSYNQKKH